MTFLRLCWSAYVPVVVLMMAAVSECTTAPRGTRVPHSSPAKRKHLGGRGRSFSNESEIIGVSAPRRDVYGGDNGTRDQAARSPPAPIPFDLLTQPLRQRCRR